METESHQRTPQTVVEVTRDTAEVTAEFQACQNPPQPGKRQLRSTAEVFRPLVIERENGVYKAPPVVLLKEYYEPKKNEVKPGAKVVVIFNEMFETVHAGG